MADDTTIGYSIEIKGTDTAVGQMGDMKRELLDLTTKFNSLKDSTSGNVGAQKAAATQMAVLSTQIKALTSDINTQQQAIIKAANEQTEAVGSYNQLSLQLSDVTAQWKALSAEERDNTEAGQVLTAQRLELNNQLKALDATVNVHTRNVGNYSGELIKNGRAVAGLAGITEILGRILGVDNEVLMALKETHSSVTMAMRDLHHVTELHTEAVEENVVATEAQVVATGEAETATEALNEEMLINPAVAVVAAVVALVAILGSLKTAAYESKAVNEAFTKSMDDIVKQCDKAIEELQKLGIEHQLLTGMINKYDADRLKSTIETNKTIKDSNTKYKEDHDKILEESNKAQDTYWGNFLNLFGTFSQKQIDITNQTNSRLASLQLAHTADTLLLNQQRIAELNKITDQENADTAKKVEENNKRLQEIQDANEKSLEAKIKANNAEILKLKAEMIKEQFDLQKAGTEREFAQIEDKYDSLILLEKAKITEKLSSNKQLRDSEIALNKAVNDQIIELEKLKEADIEKLGKATEKAEVDNLIKQNEIKKQIALQEIANDEQLAKDAVTKSTGTAKEKSEQMLAIDIEYSNRKLAVNKKAAIAELLILKNSTEADTEETKLKIAKLEGIIDQAARIPPSKTLLAQLFGTDSNNAKLIIDDAISLVKQASDAVFTAQQASNARALTAQLDHINKQNTMAANGLQAQLSAGLITQTQYDLQTAAQADKVAKEQDDAKKAAFEKDKELKKKQIGVNLALEIVKIAVAYADIPYEGWAQAAIQAGEAAAAAAIQIEAIDNEQYSGGGVLKGASHDEGGIPFSVNGKRGFEAEGDEIILTKGVFQNPYLRSMASQINVAGGGKHFALGGPVPTAMAASSSKQFVPDLSGFAQQIIQGINSKKVYQNVTEVTDKQNELQQLATDSSF